MVRFGGTASILVLAMFSGSSAAWGQAQPTVSPAQVPLPSREQVNPVPTPSPEAKSAAHVDESNAFAAGPCPLSGSDISVAIKHVQFAAPGGAALAPALVALLSGISTGSQSQPIRVVCDLRDQANARLRQARYVASVQIPPQRIDDGVLRLEVVTGHIVEVRVRGDAGPYEGLIKHRIEQLKTLNPLNAGDAERLLLQANDVPGLNIQLGLSPVTSGGKPGELVGELKVTYHRFSLVGNVQNYNSKLLGRETFYLRAEAYDLLGLADRTYLAGSTTFDFKKQRVLQFGESIGLSSAGDRLTFVSTVAYSRPKLDLLDLRTLSLIENLEYTHPLIHTVQSRIDAAGGFEYAIQRTRVYNNMGSAALNRDRISTIYARLDGDTRKLRFDGSQFWGLSGSLELRKGLNVLGSTKTGAIVDGYTPSHFDGSATATVVRGGLTGSIALGPVFELATTLRGQYSDKPLLNYDQFSIGNLTIGRGYDPGVNTGDRAIAGAHEARINVPLGQSAHGQFYAFYDWVKLWNLDPASTERNRLLQSVGGGARTTVFNSVRLDLTYAHPLDPPLLTGTNIRRSPDRVMFSLTMQIIPFGTQH